MAETNAQDRHLTGRRFDEVEADAGLVWVARARRDDAPGGIHRHRLVDRDGVVAMYLEHRSQLPQEVPEVVGEAVVIID